MVVAAVPPGVIERIVEVLDPEEVSLFGSRARQTQGPDSDWDLMAVLSNAAPDRKLDLAAVWSDLRELRRLRVEVIPMRRRDFEEDRHTPGELAEAVSRRVWTVTVGDSAPAHAPPTTRCFRASST
jgi:predicted nucleotidyltransferase